jgi:hypothetical protein
MKNKLITSILALFISLQLFSQTIEPLKVEVEKIYQSTVVLDYDAILNSTYPRVFEIIPKEQMKEVLQSTFNGAEGIKVKLLPTSPEFSFGEIFKIDKQSFCLVDHNLAMQLTLDEVVEDSEMMISIFKSAMETEKVTFDKETNSFIIYKRSTMIGIYDDFTANSWKFLNKDKNNVLANKLLSEKVIKQLGL